MFRGTLVEAARVTDIATSEADRVRQIIGTVMKSRPQADKHAMVRRFSEHWLDRFSGGRSLEPVVDSTYPLARAADAHRRMESSMNVGKIILSAATSITQA
ncbi:alcohol dehydrogenase [Caballeronia fortuita]|uniref:Alcohol dehydrogenase n=1 Tax=Caballeronia fortuita TaxID=1777138 RepID=A0A158DZJ1_9BURK|nr:zinc-binding dehydrogenase [Caballeronia fortuita]SAL00061.1 alcohol dehydrogenase [Caballeronia fortuita]